MDKKRKSGKNLRTGRPKIAILGTGNLATQLGKVVSKNGQLSGIWGRNPAKTKKLASLLKCPVISSPGDISKDTTLVIIAVKDDAITEVSNQIIAPDVLVVHTSGTGSMDLIVQQRKGVLYPLQTFSSDRMPQWKKIPLLIECSQKKDLATLKKIALSISPTVKAIHSEERMKIHLAAVMACNFSNHFMALAQEFLKKNKLSPLLLSPLIEETALKAADGKSAKHQTGPARRNDLSTIKKHLALLKHDKQMHKLYKELSLSIQHFYST